MRAGDTRPYTKEGIKMATTKAWNGTGYRPNDISGNDYASMAGMSATDRAALDAASASWKAAQAAGDKAAMDAAHRQAEALRSKYGYSGGADGSQYLPNQGFTSPYQEMLDGTAQKMADYGPFTWDVEKPVYQDQYAQQRQELLDRLLNYGDFEWSKEEDPLWPVYKKQYLREGERATANALGQAAAATGGRPSSYAVNAATQAGDYYATKLNDIIPQLYQQAYDRWANKYSMTQQDLGAVNNQEQLDYAKFLDQLSQYNTDRGFAYNQYLDDYNRLQSALGAYQGLDQTQYGRYMDQQSQKQRQQEFAQQQLDSIMAAGGTPSADLRNQSGYSGEYVDTMVKEYARTRGLSEEQAARDLADWYAGYGDLSRLQGMGVDTSYTERQMSEDLRTSAANQVMDMLEAGRMPSAELIAQSGLSQEYVQAMLSYYQQQIAQAAAKGTGSGSSGRRSSSGGSKSGSKSSGSGGGNYGSLDFDEDEGIFTWNGKKYQNLETLITDINKVELTSEQKRQLLDKFDMYGFDVGT